MELWFAEMLTANIVEKKLWAVGRVTNLQDIPPTMAILLECFYLL